MIRNVVSVSEVFEPVDQHEVLIIFARLVRHKSSEVAGNRRSEDEVICKVQFALVCGRTVCGGTVGGCS